MAAVTTSASYEQLTSAQSMPDTHRRFASESPAGPMGLDQALAAPSSTNDPTSFSYKPDRYYAAMTKQPSNRSQSRPSKRSIFRSVPKKIAGAIGKSYRRAFKPNAKKRALIMPNENVNIYRMPSIRRSSDRSSARSRRSTARMTWPAAVPTSALSPPTAIITDCNSSAPSMLLTSPSVADESKQRIYSVHAHTGPLSEPPPVQVSVKMTMPIVTAFVPAPERPLTSSTTWSFELGQTVESSSVWTSAANRYSQLNTDDSPTDSPVSADFSGQVNPKTIVRESGVDAETNPAAFAELMDTVDGMPARPSLQRRLSYTQKTDSGGFLPYSWANLQKLYGESVSAAAPESDRSAALAVLESPAPDTAAAPPQTPAIPHSLRPGPQCITITRRPVNCRRPHTTGEINFPFTPYSPHFALVTDASTSSTSAGAARPADRDSGDSSAPSFADSAAHSKHYSIIESAAFESSVPPLPANREPPAQWTDSYFPPSVAAYSGGFLPPLTPSSPPPTASPAPTNTYAPPTSSAGPAGPTGSQMRRKPVTPTVRNFSHKLSSTNLNKPLPPPPSAIDSRRFTKGVTPTRLSMNGNGYPMMSRENISTAALPAVPAVPKPRSQSASSGDARPRHGDAAMTRAMQAKKQQKQKAHKIGQAITKLMG
ncbi:hypothetical protein LTR85_006410 [Meristemomyces frigidus]|nr:hypothetical protein LTR85_006410 [Meristemomyces frigidus]